MGYTKIDKIWQRKNQWFDMKNVSLLVWVSQLGLSVAIPLAGFVLLGVWLNRQCGWGSWTIWAGILLGMLCAIQGFRNSLKAMAHLTKEEKTPPISFQEHD